MRFKTEVDARTGNESNVVRNLGMIMRLAHTLDEEPLVISWLVRMAVEQIAAEALRDAVSQMRLSDDQCLRLAQGFEGLGAANLLPRVMAGERAMMLPIFTMDAATLQKWGTEDRNMTTNEAKIASGMNVFYALGFFERDRLFYLRTMGHAIEALKAGPPQSLALTNYFDEVTMTAKKRFYIFSGMTLPALGKLSVKDALARTKVNFALCALAIERYRNQNGQLPDTIEALAPAFLKTIPIDPHDGRAIRYRREEKGYLLYSVDADGRDDGGAERPPKRSGKLGATFDLVYRVGR